MITKIKQTISKYSLQIAVAAMITFLVLFCATVIGINIVYGF